MPYLYNLDLENIYICPTYEAKFKQGLMILLYV